MITGSIRRSSYIVICLLITLTGSVYYAEDVYAQQDEEFLGALSPFTIDTTEIAALLSPTDPRELENPEPSDDGIEIDFVLEYGPLGRRYLTVYIVDEQAYLPLFDLFNLFKINISYRSSQRIASGFYIDEETEYIIDFLTQTIRVGERTGSFSDEDIRVGNNGFYLKPELFAEFFDLEFEVEPARLRLALQTDVTLPVLALQEREQARSQIREVRDGREFYPLEFPRNRKLFGSGFVDYQLSASSFNDFESRSQSLNTTYGFELLGGDMSGRLGLNRTTGGQIRTATDLSTWRYVISDNPYMTTIRAGNVSTQGLSGARVRGVSFTNEPLYNPVTFDVLPVFGVTEPGTDVELILNKRLVDFTTVDESGEYELFVPIRYGNTTLEVVEYLPDGRIRRELKDIRVPGSFLSPGEVRYSGTVGLAENGNGGIDAPGLRENDLAGSLSVSGGITRRLTATQTLYYRENEFDPWPELSTSLTGRVGAGYLVSATAAPGSRYDLQLSTLSVSRFTFSGGYTYFEPGNTQNSEVRQQASGGFSLPIRLVPKRPLLLSFSGNYSDLRGGGNRFSYRASTGFGLGGLRFRVTYRDQLSGPSSSSPATEGARATYTVSANTGNLPLISRLTGRVSLTANLDHDVENRQLTNFSMRAYKSFSSRASFNATFERDLISGFSSLQAGLQIRFNKARSTTNATYSGGSSSLTQTVTGSVGYDEHFRRFVFSERNMVGSSAASVVQFLDANANDRYDEGEQILDFDGIGFVTGGQKQLGGDGVLRLWQLPAYRQVNLSIDNIRNPNPTAVTYLDRFSIFTDPNRFKLLEIPYDYSGVAIGGLYQMKRGEKTGLGGANFIIRAKDGSFETEERTFSDGGFYVMDIPPGDYILELSPLLVSFMDVGDQLTQTEFTITPREGGDFVEGIEILLQDEQEMVPEDVSDNMLEDQFAYQVQTGSFRNRKSAEKLVLKLNNELEDMFNIYHSTFTDQYSVRTDTIANKQEALKLRDESWKVLNRPETFSLGDPFLVHFKKESYVPSGSSNDAFYLLKTELSGDAVPTNDLIDENFDSIVMKLPDEQQKRLLLAIFQTRSEAESKRDSLEGLNSGNNIEYELLKTSRFSGRWPEPMLYRLQYGTFKFEHFASELALKVNGKVELYNNLHRVVSQLESDFVHIYDLYREMSKRTKLKDIVLKPVSKNSMNEIHQIAYSIYPKNLNQKHNRYEKLCAVIDLRDCNSIVKRNVSDGVIFINQNSANQQFILKLLEDREKVEKHFEIDRFMMQIPMFELIGEK
ncbi:MAG: hypothetical protein RI573_05535 [Balneolaceae bacterium]|nr:hypothetical protein [Balneolaceae bacterium]